MSGETDGLQSTLLVPSGYQNSQNFCIQRVRYTYSQVRAGVIFADFTT